MKTKATLLLLLVQVMGTINSQADEGKVLDALSTSDWTSIRAEYDRHRHAAFPVDGGHRARHFGQQWLTKFDGRGFLVTPDSGGWTWGLELQSYGWTGLTRAVTDRPRVTAETERLNYDWDDNLRDWYVNDGRGLEHGFTLRQPPAGHSETLELNLAVRGGLDPHVRDGGRAVAFLDADGRTALTYAGLKAWDADGRALDARMLAAGKGLRLELNADGARYPLTTDPIAQQAYLKASNTDKDDHFGSSVAISGDTVVVGATQEDSSATGINGRQDDNSVLASGAAYVYVRIGGLWSQQAYLKAPYSGISGWFGYSVAISGDTVVVAASIERSNATGVNGDQGNNSAPVSGAAYVFLRSGGVWSQQTYLKASNSDEVDVFSFSVAISGDTVVVGAPFEDSSATGVNGNKDDNSASSSGAAYIFSVPPPPFIPAGLVHSARLKSGELAEQGIVSLFGVSLADFNADAVLPFGTELGGASVDVTDTFGVTRPCLMFAARVETEVSPAQLNFMIPAGTATGPATLTARRPSGGSYSIAINVVEVVPGIFTANGSGSGAPAANTLRYVNGVLTGEPTLVFDVSAFPFQATHIDLGPTSH